jgi:predicted DNA binding CopG/RHH family protein
MKDKNKLENGKFDYGNVEMTDEEYRESQNPKVRTTMFLEADLIRIYKREAAKRGVKYQQLMREKLRGALNAPIDIESRLQRLEQEVLKKRTAK